MAVYRTGDTMKKVEIIKDNINTEAISNLKGIGLQKLRAVERLLCALQEKRSSVFCTIEYVDDVFEYDMSNGTNEIRSEQNKNYSSDFSINSIEIKNSIRIFIDTWRRIDEDENIIFVFYSNAGTKKERKVGQLAKFDELPEKGLLDLLKEQQFDVALSYVIPVIKEYYIEQHKSNSNSNESESERNYYKVYIDSLTFDQWKAFFKLIEWRFDEKNEREVRECIDKTVGELCIQYNVDSKYQSAITARLYDLVESQAMEDSFLKRMVHVAQIELLFKDFAREAKMDERLDPLHYKWDALENLDARDLQEKILGVCADFDDISMEEIQDDFVDGKYEQDQYDNPKAIKAYNYRIYSKCKREIKRFLIEKEHIIMTENIILSFLDKMTDEAYAVVLDKSKTYDIPYLDRDMVYKSILILFQECFIALD